MDIKTVNFQIDNLDQKLEKYNEVISKGRCRIFYLGANRNFTWITKEFAQKLLSSIAYAPVKGIYDSDEVDYTDHGKKRSQGRIYGVVPAEPNIKWEKHLDEDGIQREYVSVDVLYYTGLYNQAQQICGKSQSMELYAQTLTGDYKIINGKKYYVFEDGDFLGLQVLGDTVQPCFEGAAFYELNQSIHQFIDQVNKYNNTFKKENINMPEILFRLSDDEKRYALNDLLNSEVTEDGYRIYCYSVTDVYDDYAIAYNYSEQQYERIYYTKNDSNDSVQINKKVRCHILDVTDTELNVLNHIREINNGSFDLADNIYTEKENLVQENLELSTKNVELNNNLSTLNTERDNLSNELETKNNSYNELNELYTKVSSERDELSIYKKTVEDNKKISVIQEYADVLSEEVIDNFKKNIDNYTCEQLDMHLTYEQKKSNPKSFKQDDSNKIVPKDGEKDGIESILSHYERK